MPSCCTSCLCLLHLGQPWGAGHPGELSPGGCHMPPKGKGEQAGPSGPWNSWQLCPELAAGSQPCLPESSPAGGEHACTPSGLTGPRIHSLLRGGVVVGHEAEAVQHRAQLLQLLVGEHAQLVSPARDKHSPQGPSHSLPPPGLSQSSWRWGLQPIPLSLPLQDLRSLLEVTRHSAPGDGPQHGQGHMGLVPHRDRQPSAGKW